MRNFLVHNKLPGKAYFEIGVFPQFYSWPDCFVPVPVTLNPQIGNETALLYIDRTPFIYKLGRVRPFALKMKTGLAHTANGPLMFLLFYVPDPQRPGHAVTTADCYLNPLDPESLDLWRQLDSQSHWHLILLGERMNVVDLFEFDNTYDLGDTMDQAVDVCKSLPAKDFNLAKQEFFERYTMEQMYGM